MDTVHTAWDSTPNVSNDYLMLQNKLRAKAVSFQKWSNRWIGNVKLHISIA